MESNLPQGWVETEISKIADIKYGKDFRKSDFTDSHGYPVYSANGIIGYSKYYNKESKTVVLGCRGSVGSVHITKPKSYITHNCFAIEPNNLISNEFVYYLLKGIDMSDVITGTAQPQITITNLSPLKIPLPPLAEQKRIANKLDQIFSRIDVLKERMEKVPKLLKKFRQSVLQAAVSGELTKDWRFEKGIKDEWIETKLNEISTLVTSGSRGWAKYYSDKGSIFIRAQNINRDILDLSDVAFVQLPNSIEGKRTLIRENDLLITITGANVTKTAHVNFDIKDSYVSQHVGLVRIANDISSKYIHLYLICESYGRKQLLDFAYGQGKPQLNLDNLKNVEILLPNLDEQKEIIKQVEALLKKADEIEKRYKQLEKYINKLPQSVLERAFNGELVAQDPEDEPAEVLLGRIKQKLP